MRVLGVLQHIEGHRCWRKNTARRHYSMSSWMWMWMWMKPPSHWCWHSNWPGFGQWQDRPRRGKGMTWSRVGAGHYWRPASLPDHGEVSPGPGKSQTFQETARQVRDCGSGGRRRGRRRSLVVACCCGRMGRKRKTSYVGRRPGRINLH